MKPFKSFSPRTPRRYNSRIFSDNLSNKIKSRTWQVSYCSRFPITCNEPFAPAKQIDKTPTTRVGFLFHSVGFSKFLFHPFESCKFGISNFLFSDRDFLWRTLKLKVPDGMYWSGESGTVKWISVLLYTVRSSSF